MARTKQKGRRKINILAQKTKTAKKAADKAVNALKRATGAFERQRRLGSFVGSYHGLLPGELHDRLRKCDFGGLLFDMVMAGGGDGNGGSDDGNGGSDSPHPHPDRAVAAADLCRMVTKSISSHMKSSRVHAGRFEEATATAIEATATAIEARAAEAAQMASTKAYNAYEAGKAKMCQWTPLVPEDSTH